MINEKELAYRYDLIISTEWQERFDELIFGKFEIPDEGQVLIFNCGTGTLSIEIAERLKAGEVFALDPSPERLKIARAKAAVKKLDNIIFEQDEKGARRLLESTFDAVIADASLLPAIEYRVQVRSAIEKAARVSRPDALVLLSLATRGSFDEFFSIYWESLHDCNLDQRVWTELEEIINARPTAAEAEELCRQAGLRKVESVTTTEGFEFPSGAEFLESPLIKDTFLDDWLSVLEIDDQDQVRDRMISIIDEERGGGAFYISIRATVIAARR
ncbi:MAG: hypothetical protein DMF61_12675 [Blastocatellia bacterium AA13]|nr:MAG: hypothetical protein DMF61_12675 [Blastocatellia bacterium AA13]